MDAMKTTDASGEPTAAQLLGYGYAPGDYMGNCKDCRTQHWDLDKRAIRCKACATAAWRRNREAGALASAPPAPTPNAGLSANRDLEPSLQKDLQKGPEVPPPGEDLAGQGEPPTVWIRRAIMANLKGDADGVDEAVAVIVSNLESLNLAGQGEPVAWASGGHQPHPFQPHEKYPGCAVCGYAASERLMHPAVAAPAPSRPADREEIARAMARHRILHNQFTWNPREPLSSDSIKRAEDSAWKDWLGFADAVLALRDAPRDAGDGTQAARDVLAERRRQVECERWTPEHDDAHSKGEMAYAAAAYAIHAGYLRRDRCDPRLPPAHWPWSVDWWKPTTARRDLVKAGALILAEIERLDRLPSPNPTDGTQDTDQGGGR